MGDRIAQRDLRNDISAILRRVAGGESFTVTVRGEPIAELVPSRVPRRFVPRGRVEEILRANSADRALLEELREMDVDDSVREFARPPSMPWQPSSTFCLLTGVLLPLVPA